MLWASMCTQPLPLWGAKVKASGEQAPLQLLRSRLTVVCIPPVVAAGRFVPNITIGPLVVDALRPVTDKVLDCHLVSRNLFWDKRILGMGSVSVFPKQGGGR